MRNDQRATGGKKRFLPFAYPEVAVSPMLLLLPLNCHCCYTKGKIFFFNSSRVAV